MTFKKPRVFIGLSIISFFCACGNPEKKSSAENSGDTIAINTNKDTQSQQPELPVGNQFPAAWLDSVKALGKKTGMNSFKTNENCLIFDSDTVCTSNTLNLKRNYLFSGVTDSLHFELILSRINYTDMKYNYVVKEKSSVVFQNSGKVRLTPGFYLGSESADDDITGGGYLIDEYINLDKNGFTIDMEGSPETKNKIRAIVKPAVYGKFYPKGLTLRAKTE